MIPSPHLSSGCPDRLSHHASGWDRVKALSAHIAAAGLFMAGALMAGCQSGIVPGEAASPDKPDIILVLTDDQGWGDWEGSGNDVIQTPAMMELARQGASFTDFHVSPVCAPTRASLLSGRHSLETGVWGVTRGGERMRPEVETLAEALRKQGYRTGVFGKWHNGDSPPYDPQSQGFDRFYGFDAGHLTDYFDPVLTDDGEAIRTKGYITTLITDAALDWMRAETDQPTFTYVAYNTPHGPFEVEPRYLEPYAQSGLPLVTQVIYAMTTQTDEQFGRLLEAADEDAIVIFVGDNGPARPGGVDRYKDGLNGQKGSVLFGGTQVPMLIRWAGVTRPGSEIATPGHGTDILPTLLAAVGGTPASEVDGLDLRPLLMGGTLPERTLFTHHSNVLLGPDTIPVEVDPGAARRGRFSAVLDPDGEWALYADRAQAEDVKAQHPEVFADLKEQYLAWFETVSPHAKEELPTVLQGERIALSAHNGYPEGDAAFNGEWGWAHDWINIDGTGAIRWPVSSDGGRYEVEVLYSGDGGVGLGDLRHDLPFAEAPPALPGPGHRRIVTSGEAVTRLWPSERFGPVALPSDMTQLRLTVDGEASIKGLVLHPVP